MLTLLKVAHRRSCHSFVFVKIFIICIFPTSKMIPSRYWEHSSFGKELILQAWGLWVDSQNPVKTPSLVVCTYQAALGCRDRWSLEFFGQSASHDRWVSCKQWDPFLMRNSATKALHADLWHPLRPKITILALHGLWEWNSAREQCVTHTAPGLEVHLPVIMSGASKTSHLMICAPK